MNLLLIVHRQHLLLSSEPDSDLFKLLFVSLRCYPELLHLLLQLVTLPFSFLVLGLYNLLLFFHLVSLDLRRLHPLLQLSQQLLYIHDSFSDTIQLTLHLHKLSAKFFAVVYLLGKKYPHALCNLQPFEEEVSLPQQIINGSHPLKQHQTKC